MPHALASGFPPRTSRRRALPVSMQHLGPTNLKERFVGPQHGEGQALALREGEAFFSHRSAGACPPRTLDCADDGEGQALALREGEAFFLTVARGPVPRERWSARAMARDRPSPYDEGGLSAAAPPVGAPSYCIETRRSRLRGVMKHPHLYRIIPNFVSLKSGEADVQ